MRKHFIQYVRSQVGVRRESVVHLLRKLGD